MEKNSNENQKSPQRSARISSCDTTPFSPILSNHPVSTSAISIQNLSKEFIVPFKREPVGAVKNLSIEIPAGEVYGMLGPNGSGKSTTMKILLGLVAPTSGSTHVFGVNSRSVESRENVGFLPENPYFYKYLTGMETLLFFGKLCGLTGSALADKAASLLKTVGLENAADRRLGGYSKGMLQRIGLAQALVGDPRLLVLDEPTAGVDPAGSHAIRDLVLQLKSEGLTVFLCSHLLNQVQEICDRVGVMHQGRLVAEGRIDDLVDIKNQTEWVVENASEGLADAFSALALASGARLVAQRKPHADLERFFLRVTDAASHS